MIVPRAIAPLRPERLTTGSPPGAGALVAPSQVYEPLLSDKAVNDLTTPAADDDAQRRAT